ncbi:MULTISPECIES: tetratricopeptide repeat protein [unclassified Massilia]|uniref:tetratricopeptide repeat protein n=1 Tax=unclassified Massilia TaxID=2609279 RepID=UPI0017830782|nr:MULTISPECIES: SEL1-like repeat protein [unclassified Massilia]MBD8530282.1 sel1 repeat family protein [Massilia sp. CFBP 13647]MBD8673059.1 sel1 repeat family protein [Massilia sp. CFBP 13721]
MRRILLSLLLVSSAAMADDMTDAYKYLMANEFGKALPLYTRLANAGNAEAQFRLGEMAWYGDGAPQDLQAAQRWFEKSAAGGNTDAREALAALERRKTRGGEIAYWTGKYDGADLQAGQFECTSPTIPPVSKSNADIDATRTAIAGWRACYNGFVANLNATAPVAKRIPADVLDMMTPREIDSARTHIESVYRTVLTSSEREADQVKQQQLAWESATSRFAREENQRVERVQREETRRIVDSRKGWQDNAAMQRPGPAPSAPTLPAPSGGGR